MKYPNWNEYYNAKKWKAVADEVKFLGQEATRLQAEVYKAEAENARLRKVLHIAQEMVDSNRGGLVPGYKFSKLEQALAKLDKEGER